MNATLARAVLDVASKVEALKWELEFGPHEALSPVAHERLTSDIKALLQACRSSLRTLRAVPFSWEMGAIEDEP